jgi:hypothetical protein
MLEAPAWVAALYKDICMFARDDATGLMGRGARGRAPFGARVRLVQEIASLHAQ